MNTQPVTPDRRRDRALAGSLRVGLAGIYELPAATGRIVPMDGMRGLAILLVFLVHFHSLFSPYLAGGSLPMKISEAGAIIGNTGVDLFFFISGWLIYSSILHRRAEWLLFLRRRTRRIYPVLLSVLAVYLAVSIAFPSVSKIPPGAGAAAIYLFQNIALLPGVFDIPPIITVAWSLSYEMLFYLTIPILVWGTSMGRWARRRRMLFFALFMAFLFALTGLISGGQHMRFVMFTAGILAYEILSHDRFRQSLSLKGEMVSALVFIAGFVLVWQLRVWYDSQRITLPEHNLCRSLALVPAVSGLGIYCLGREGLLARVFSWTPLRWIGNISYSYFLFHGLTLKGVQMLIAQFWPVRPHSPAIYGCLLLIGLVATVISSTILFVLIEKPFSLKPHSAGLATASGR
ncbi:MAG TPA: acyltransferase [Blastocatellia bacterium]|nr:acyltransferase [Blastocatellia bacterium]